MRLKAMTLDLGIIAGWAGFSAVAGLVSRWVGLDLDTAPAADGFAFATLVAPVVATFARQEASSEAATLGKRRCGLAVVDKTGHGLTLGRSMARSVAKFLPWQLAHTAVFGLVADPNDTRFMALSVAAQVMVLGSVLIMAVDARHRALHDLIAGTLVVDRRAPGTR